VARVNPDKLVRNFQARVGKPNEIVLNWDLPVNYATGEEIVVTRRKDAFPVEIRNPNYEDRYTDVAQVEVFRGSTIYCSHLTPLNDTLIIGTNNSFYPLTITEFERDNKYTGRLIRDEAGQVFRITKNTEAELTIENVSTNPNNRIDPVEGAFVILAEYTKIEKQKETVSLIPNTNTLKVTGNMFSLGDNVTIKNTIALEFGTDWVAGVTASETAQNIAEAIRTSGILYPVEVYGDTLLISKGTEDTLSVTTNSASVAVTGYSIAGNKVFVQEGRFQNSYLRDLSLQFGGNRYFVKSNVGKLIELYEDVAPLVLPNNDFTVLPNFNNSFTVGLSDRAKSYLEVLTKKFSGLEDDKFYYYTAFNSKLRSMLIVNNEGTEGLEDVLNYSVDRVASTVSRIYYEDIIELGQFDFTYNDLTGVVEFSGNPDLSETDIQVGDLFADSTGARNVIVSTDLINGTVTLAPNLTLSTIRYNPLHGAVTRANIPFNFGDVLVGDTFTDIAGMSFPIVGTQSSPTQGVSVTPGNAVDVSQGLIDSVIVQNIFLVPYTYAPESGIVQYGERQITLNRLLAAMSYNNITGIVQYSGTTIDLTQVEIGDTFIDGVGNKFEVLGVNHQTQQIELNPSLIVSVLVTNNRAGSIIREEGFTDVEGNLLIDLSTVLPGDLLKTNSRPNLVIESVDAPNGRLTLVSGLEDISTVVQTPFDGSVNRRGRQVAWAGYEGELLETLQVITQGGIRRYSSVNDVQYALFSTPNSTQTYSVSCQDRAMGAYLYKAFPNLFKALDTTGDLEDLMQVFGKEINEIFTLVNNAEYQNADIIIPKFLRIAAQSKGTDLTNENLGIDTRRRFMRDIVTTYKSKGTRQGIFEFIKILTTWDITNGTGDLIEAITDDTPDVTGLRFFSPSLGEFNTRFIDTLFVESPPAGRFVKGIPGISLPGFFQFKEVIINLPNIAMEIGLSENLSLVGGTTILLDNAANFGQVNSLVGCFLIPNEGNPNDFYEITSNTATTITVNGSIPSDALGAKYLVLSPLNQNRFTTLTASIGEFMPFNTVPVFNFTLTKV
jgi:hypothetical protein